MRDPMRQLWVDMLNHPQAIDVFGWSLAGGLLRYEALATSTNPNMTSWKLDIYGGPVFEDAAERASLIVAHTVPAAAATHGAA